MHIGTTMNQKYIGNLGGYARLYESANKPGGKIDLDKSLAGWQQRTIVKHKAIQKMDEEHEKNRAKFEAEYLPNVAKEKIAPYQEERDAVVKLAQQEATTDLLETLEGHLKRFDSSLGAPTEEQLRLLQTVSLRDDVTPGELATIAQTMQGNLNAMSALRSIAKKSGLTFPKLPDRESFEQELAEAEAFGNDMINAMGAEKKGYSYDQACFFDAPGTGKAGFLFGRLDNNGFSAATIKEAEAEPPQDAKAGEQPVKEKAAMASPSSKNATKVFCRGGESLDVIAMQFHTTADAIRAANPEENLDSLYHGRSFIVPGVKMTITKERGAVGPEQCIAMQYTPEETPAYQEGQEVGIE